MGPSACKEKLPSGSHFLPPLVYGLIIHPLLAGIVIAWAKLLSLYTLLQPLGVLPPEIEGYLPPYFRCQLLDHEN